jgi:hypothetical protein
MASRFVRLASGTFRAGRRACGFCLVLSAFAGTAMATPSTPEIDPGTGASALALLSGGILLLTDRFYRRRR